MADCGGDSEGGVVDGLGGLSTQNGGKRIRQWHLQRSLDFATARDSEVCGGGDRMEVPRLGPKE